MLDILDLPEIMSNHNVIRYDLTFHVRYDCTAVCFTVYRSSWSDAGCDDVSSHVLSDVNLQQQ